MRAPAEVAVVWTASLASAMLAFAFSIVLARTVDAATFGTFMTVFAVSRLAAPVAQGGVSEMWLQAFGRHGRAASAWIVPGLGAMASTAGLAVLAMTGWAMAFAPSGDAGELAIVMAVAVALGAPADNAIAEPMLRGRFVRVALWQLAPYLVRMAAVGVAAAVLWRSGGTRAVGGPLVITLVVGTALTSVIGMRWILRLRRDPPTDDAPTHEPLAAAPAAGAALARSFPFAVQGLAYLAVLQAGTIALGSAKLVEDAGHLAVGMNIVTAMHLLPSAVFARVFAPRYFLWGNSDPARLARTAPRVLAWVIVASVVASIAAWFVLPWAIPLVFGQAQQAAVAPARTLALAFPVWCLAAGLAAHHTTPTEVRWRTLCWVGLAAITIGGCILQAPTAGLDGVVQAIIAGQVAFAILTLIGQLVFVGPRWRAAS
jgi:O-antigen/teichoic acid export membrane protein